MRISLNLKLKVRHALTEMHGKHKMNDAFAVELFSVDNLVTLLSCSPSEIDLCEVEYLSRFFLWYYCNFRCRPDKAGKTRPAKDCVPNIPEMGIDKDSFIWRVAFSATDLCCSRNKIYFLHGSLGSRATLEYDCS
jgi:hypothetical protein